MTAFLAGWVPSERMVGKVLVSCQRQYEMADRNRQNRILEILSDRQYRRSMIMSCDIFCRPVCAHAKRLPSKPSSFPGCLFPDDDLLFKVDPVLQPAQHVHAEQSVMSCGRTFMGDDKDIPVALRVRSDSQAVHLD